MPEHAIRQLSTDGLIGDQSHFATGLEADLAVSIADHSFPIAAEFVHPDLGIV